MDNLSVYFTKFINMFNIPAAQFFLVSLVGSVGLYFVNQTAYLKKNSWLFVTLLAVLVLVYFGIPQVALLIILLLGSYLLAKRILKIQDNLLSLIVGIFAFVQLFIFVALPLGPTISLYVLTLLSLLLFVSRLDQSIEVLLDLKQDLSGIISSFNVYDWWLIITSFILSSLPQHHWDAVHANLYNAKWYIVNNSFAPLTESISSLFPQNAIAYYALFYKIGTYHGLQLSFILPLILMIFIVKKIIFKAKIAAPYTIMIYAALLTPIVVFESSNGYYDLLIAALMLSAVYAVSFIGSRNVIQSCLSAAFLIGFAAGMKFFSLALIMLPIAMLYLHRDKIKHYFVPAILLSLFLSTFSLGIWAYRTYTYTGSPVYPFYQDYFPTPHMWSGHDNLEQNFMIQTTMDAQEWTKGGFLAYPVASYLRSGEYMEATGGYPGAIYIVSMLIQLIILLSLTKNIFTKKLEPSDIIFLFSFAIYFVVGMLTRYYRYLMPFQFILLVSSAIVASRRPLIQNKFKYSISCLFFLVIGLNFINLVGYYRYYPINHDQLYSPDYYQKPNSLQSPVNYLNQNGNAKDRVLDASVYLLPRLHLIPKTFECNWYWINGPEQLAAKSYEEIKAEFRYFVTADPPENTGGYCQALVEKVIADPSNLLIYSDHLTHRIYELHVP